MATFVIRLREGPPLAVEGSDVGYYYPEGGQVPVIFVIDEQGNRVALLPGDVTTVVYRKESERATEGGIQPM